MVSDVIDHETGEWKIDHLTNFLTEEDFGSISAMPIGKPNQHDRIIWPYSENGDYIVKSGYHFNSPSVPPIVSTSSAGSYTCDNTVWRIVWNLDVAPKIRVFIWKAIAGALPVFGDLYKRHISSSPCYSLCGDERETIEHCLLHCPANARRIWFTTSWGYCSTNDPNSTMDRWFLKMFNVPEKAGFVRADFMASIPYTLFEIWKARCSYIYNGHALNHIRPCIAAASNCNEFIDNLRKHHLGSTPLTSPPSCHCWTRPPINQYKLNSDAGWNANIGTGYLGIIIRESNGLMIAGKSQPRLCNSAHEAEAYAMVLGVETACDIAIQNLVVECDNQPLISAVTAMTTNWKLQPFVDHLTALALSLNSVTWEWISRNANHSADAAVKLCKKGSHSLEWTSNPPSPLFCVLRNDGLPCPLVAP